MVIKNAKFKEPGTIVLSDLSINSAEDVNEIEESSVKAKEYGCDLIWLDPHYWKEEIKTRVRSFANLILSP
jgi:oligoribonuclease NrnB/cAMP/cGMP phosphodiesterase (DHH superfamily)